VDTDEEQAEDADNKVALMTVHSAKGLEFPHVFIAGMEENIFPGGGMMTPPNEVEEERRLLYVAITRAKKTVEISFAETRLRNGRHESNPPSRFLKEIDPQYIDRPLTDDDFAFSAHPDPFKRYGGLGSDSRFGAGKGADSRFGGSRRSMASFGKPVTTATTRPAGGTSVSSAAADTDFIPTPPEQLSVGMRVQHNRFGNGIIEEMSGSGADTKARINFDDSGIKVIMLKYAKIRKIS